MKPVDLKLDEIANRITDAVLEERFINKESLLKRIRPILKIWLKRADGVKNCKTKPATVHKLQWTVQAKRIEARYWLEVLRKEIGEDAMKPYYDKQTDYLKENDAYFYNEPIE